MSMTKPTLDEIIVMFSGKGGNPDAESVLVDNNTDKKEDGTVSFWSNKNDAAKVIKRCKNAIKRYELVGDGIQLTIDRRAFRGILYSFRSVDE